MSLIPHFHHRGPFAPLSRAMDDMFNEMANFERNFGIQPYWRNAGPSLHVGNALSEVVNDDKRFAVDLDVSHFRPEELKVNLDGKLLTIEADQETDDGQGNYMKRSFTRKWLLPDDVNVAEVKSSLSDKGHLTIEAPKTGQTTSRPIPISFANKPAAVEEKKK